MHHFILTTISFLRITFDDHISLLGNIVFDTAILNNFHVASFGNPSFGSYLNYNVLTARDVQLMCASSHKQQSQTNAEEILIQYIDREVPAKYWKAEQSTTSCVLFDMESDYIFLIGDGTGSIPLWYAFKESIESSSPEFIVSSDLLTVSHLGFKHITPVGTGMTICLDSLKRTIVSVNHWTDYSSYGTVNPSLSDAAKFSLRLLTLTHEALRSIAAHETIPTIVSELDMSDSSSMLMECSLSSFDLNHSRRTDQSSSSGVGSGRVVFRAEALVADRSSIDDFTDDHTISLIRSLDSTERKLRDPSMMRVAHERARLCNGIAVDYGDRTILSFDSPFGSPRPLKVYFQNLFCGRAGVTVLYPMATPALFDYMSPIRHPSSLFNMAVEWLVSADQCGGPISPQRIMDFQSEHVEQFHDITEDDILLRNEDTSFENRLLRTANWHAHPLSSSFGREVFLLLVTSSYAEIFVNFMCHVSQLRDLQSQHMFVVLTPHDDIARIATSYGLGSVMVRDADAISMLEREVPNYRRDRPPIASVEGSEFGMVLYQELIYFRTHAANVLLRAGFNVVISDIDMVWMRNPLAQIAETERGDVFVTLDGEEICGCFLYLNNTNYTTHFWELVTKKHRQIIVRNALDSATNHMERMFESEQTIISGMIIKSQYEHHLTVWVLNPMRFPSGVEYFAHPEKYSDVVSIHNNFIIGSAMKKIRFQRHDLWKVRDDWHPHMYFDHCISDMRQDSLTPLFMYTRKDVIPSLAFVLPIHNDIIYSNRVKVMVVLDGFPGNTALGSTKGRLWLERYPDISYLEFAGGFSVVELNVGEKARVLRFAVSLGDNEVLVSADVGMNSPVFGVDTNRKWLAEASAYVARITAGSSQNDSMAQLACREPLRASHRFQYHIKVLGYNRPHSLLRLLNSLALADYGEGNIVNLYIYIDHWGEDASEDERMRCEESFSIGMRFLWEYGFKKVEKRSVHAGLAGQWFAAGAQENTAASADDVLNEDIITLVFEDDMEVSPFFFLWTLNAVETYYTDHQRALHRELHDAMKVLIASDADNTSALDSFIRDHAGEGLMYGASLSKQYLDPAHYPQDLEIRNNHKPFLYRNWWQWKTSGSARSSTPFVDDLITDKFYKDNPSIWSPWLIRFAYETGAKCLYPNIPGNLSLATNLREKGANYVESLGPRTVTLQRHHITNPATCGEIAYDNVIGKLWYFPLRRDLLRWQYDLGLRRAGVSNGHADSSFVSVNATTPNDQLEAVGEQQWEAILAMVEAYVDQDDLVLHLEPTELLRHMLLVNSRHHLILSAQCMDDTFTDIQCVNVVEVDNWRSAARSVRMLVLDASAVISKKIDMDVFWAEIALFPQLEYVLVVGVCTGAPTEIAGVAPHRSYACRNGDGDVGSMCADSTMSGADITVSFTVVEDVCRESGIDLGASLYKNVNMVDPRWKEKRFGVSRRIAGNIVTRRVMMRRSEFWRPE